MLAGAVTAASAADAPRDADAGVDLAIDPSACLARHGGTVDDPDWTRFAAGRRASLAGGDEVERYLERAAAICLARAAGLGPGEGAREARLLYLADEERVVWIVASRRRGATPEGGAMHRELFIDAVSGEPLHARTYFTRAR